MQKYLFLLFCFVLMFSCKTAVEEQKETTIEPQGFSFQSYAKTAVLSDEAMAILQTNEAYTAFEDSFAVLKRATNTEDLKLAVKDLIEKEKALQKKGLPTQFNVLQIKSRQQVFRTFLYKVQASLIDNREIKEPMEQMISAYNAYNNQFNILLNNTLDPELILDEK